MSALSLFKYAGDTTTPTTTGAHPTQIDLLIVPMPPRVYKPTPATPNHTDCLGVVNWHDFAGKREIHVQNVLGQPTNKIGYLVLALALHPFHGMQTWPLDARQIEKRLRFPPLMDLLKLTTQPNCHETATVFNNARG